MKYLSDKNKRKASQKLSMALVVFLLFLSVPQGVCASIREQWDVADVCGETDDSMEICGNLLISKPQIINNISDIIINAGEQIQLEVIGDNYKLYENVVDVIGLPAGAEYKDGVFCWTPDNNQLGSYQVSFQLNPNKVNIQDKKTVTIDILQSIGMVSAVSDGAFQETDSEIIDTYEPNKNFSYKNPKNLNSNILEEKGADVVEERPSAKAEKSFNSQLQSFQNKLSLQSQPSLSSISNNYTASSSSKTNIIYAKQTAVSSVKTTDPVAPAVVKEPAQVAEDSAGQVVLTGNPHVMPDVPVLFDPGVSSFDGSFRLSWTDVSAPFYEIKQFRYHNYQTEEKTFVVNTPYRDFTSIDNTDSGYYYYQVRAFSGDPAIAESLNSKYSNMVVIGLFYDRDVNIFSFSHIGTFTSVSNTQGTNRNWLLDGTDVALNLNYDISNQDFAGLYLKNNEPVDISKMNSLNLLIKGDSLKGFPVRMVIELKSNGKVYSTVFVTQISDEYQALSFPFYCEEEFIDEVTLLVEDSSDYDGTGAVYIKDLFFSEDKYKPDVEPDVATNAGEGLSDSELIDKVKADTSLYFFDEVLGVGHVKDSSMSDFSSVAATGFGLSSMVVLAENYGTSLNWLTVTPEMARQRALDVLTAFCDIQAKQATNSADNGISGFFYHFIDENELPANGSEVSVVDTALLVAGAIVAGEYFGGDVKEKADELYANIDWTFFIDVATHQFYMGWKPGSSRGFSLPKGGGYLSNALFNTSTDEILLITLLALGNHFDDELVRKSYFSYPRESKTYKARSGLQEGVEYEVVNSYFGSAFTYLYAHCFFDFENMGPDRTYFAEEDNLNAVSVDWWRNSVEAFKANRQFCIDERDNYPFSYSSSLWGISAVQRPDGRYEGRYGAVPFSNGPGHDGCVSLYTPLSSMPFFRKSSNEKPSENEGFQVMRYLYNNFYMQSYGPYGFYESVDNEGNFSSVYLGLDQGPIVTMIENYQTGLIWQYFSQNEKIKTVAGFVAPNSFDWLDVKFKNIVSNQEKATAALSFGVSEPGATLVLAEEYLEINYNCATPTAKMVVYSDNMNNTIAYTGDSDPAGMVGVSDASYVVPLSWVVFDKLVVDGYAFSGDVNKEAKLQDVSAFDFPLDDMLEKRTLVDGLNMLAPYPFTNRETVCSSLYMYWACNFDGAIAQDYSTDTITIEIYHE